MKQNPNQVRRDPSQDSGPKQAPQTPTTECWQAWARMQTALVNLQTLLDLVCSDLIQLNADTSTYASEGINNLRKSAIRELGAANDELGDTLREMKIAAIRSGANKEAA